MERYHLVKEKRRGGMKEGAGDSPSSPKVKDFFRSLLCFKKKKHQRHSRSLQTLSSQPQPYPDPNESWEDDSCVRERTVTEEEEVTPVKIFPLTCGFRPHNTEQNKPMGVPLPSTQDGKGGESVSVETDETPSESGGSVSSQLRPETPLSLPTTHSDRHSHTCWNAWEEYLDGMEGDRPSPASGDSPTRPLPPNIPLSHISPHPHHFGKVREEEEEERRTEYESLSGWEDTPSLSLTEHTPPTVIPKELPVFEQEKDGGDGEDGGEEECGLSGEGSVKEDSEETSYGDILEMGKDCLYEEPRRDEASGFTFTTEYIQEEEQQQQQQQPWDDTQIPEGRECVESGFSFHSESEEDKEGEEEMAAEGDGEGEETSWLGHAQKAEGEEDQTSENEEGIEEEEREEESEYQFQPFSGGPTTEWCGFQMDSPSLDENTQENPPHCPKSESVVTESGGSEEGSEASSTYKGQLFPSPLLSAREERECPVEEGRVLRLTRFFDDFYVSKTP